MSEPKVTDEQLRERVADLRAWGRSRIDWCSKVSSSTVFEAAVNEQERRTLQAVLRILDGEIPCVAEITKAVREADRAFQKSGGSSRHWVRECLIPALWKHGLDVVRVRSDEERQKAPGGECQHRVESLGGPWCAKGRWRGEKEEREAGVLCPFACPDYQRKEGSK